ncbi:hypothetical protein KEJ15_03240 [Candidatus Bathyarchaeota archaeon]|nr:hypothetical protein [Candidatus Bathyarchaeota archaeon]
MEAGQEAHLGTSSAGEAQVNIARQEQVAEEDEQYYAAPEEVSEKTEEKQDSQPQEHTAGRASFVHGLSVGLGLGCIATFIIMWITVFFTPQIPPQATYEALLSIFVYPLVYLLAVGLVALTAGVVREYYVRTKP